MGRAISAFSGSAAATLQSVLSAFWHEIIGDAYHPERHYMRGPGPAWRAKHGQP